MSTPKGGGPGPLAALGRMRVTDALGAAAAAVGLVLVVIGVVLQERSGVDYGASIRSLGGVSLLVGVGLLLFGDRRRWAAVTGAARRFSKEYRARTAGWRWPDRVGLACAAAGLALLAPALLLQFLFGPVFGVMVIAPGIALFCAGVALLVYGRFQKRDEKVEVGPTRVRMSSRRQSSHRQFGPRPSSSGEKRGGRRGRLR